MSDIARRRRLPAPERRASLVEAASELFAEHGYEGVSLDRVAESAGVTKVIVYRHFGSKKDLYLQLLASHRDELLGTLAHGMSAGGTLQQRVPAVADAWFAYVEINPFAWRMLFQDVTGDADIRAFHAAMRDTARAAIARLLSAERDLQMPSALVEPTAELLRSAMTGLALWWLDHPRVARETLVRTVVLATWQGLAGSLESRRKS